MREKFTIKRRIHVGFILAMAFLLVLASNRLNRRNFSTVEYTVNSVFEDRVVAQEYIYRLNNLFHEKELRLASTEWKKSEMKINEEINSLLSDFETTKLTQKESGYFEQLKSNYLEFHTLENSHLKNQNTDTKIKMSTVLNEINENLNKLSEVQLLEGRQLTQLSKKSLKMNKLLSTLEISFLIIIGGLFIFVIFDGKKSKAQMAKENAYQDSI
jgi:hypothetical protein